MNVIFTRVAFVAFVSFCSSSHSYAGPGVVTFALRPRRTQRVWSGGTLGSPAVPVHLLSAGLRSPGVLHRVLAADPPSARPPSLRSTSPVCCCRREWPAGWHLSVWMCVNANVVAESSVADECVMCLQGDPSCRRSALLKDDNLLEFYYDDVRTVYEMFQRGLKISGDGRSSCSSLLSWI